ncbi:hypothetical protein SAMN05444266_111165 [Chitinophaga jiangningensis]|uniref:Uncharacterized protein n=1 Tax=Chitinophaga jiangningensis TaxID=1419482 RepID=A0A1M7LVA3_9BACT|nr:DUF5682 family protein [Chitinophaga jiangningensis]SHM82169.1 hypothetical protein SAMN05444266_111165 [Chitinophaga jiangningensis]
MSVHILGIRHHGPGSARNVRACLEALQPDIVLVEGPPEADPLLQWVGHDMLQPPVAILAYEPEIPAHSAFYPFATYSPEWQAITYARSRNIPVKFMDLPLTHVFALENEKTPEEEAPPADAPAYHFDPIALLATADGYEDAEAWWDHMFEYRRNNEGIFDAVMESMELLREELSSRNDAMNQLREAWMRKLIRQAQKEMYTEIAVVCGAWHAPALKHMPPAKADNELLKGLPKVKIACSWTPWTFERLSSQSGYRAGITSPGWYLHKWEFPDDNGTRWLTNVARLFREKQMDISTAHVMEAVRLSNALAAMRALPMPALEELNEATVSVLCNGDTMPMQLIQQQLIVSNHIGAVPDDVPKAPLQADIEKQQKKLRLPLTADYKDYQLDLREANDLQRSILLHRLQLLDINWGEQRHADGKGTFKEQWRLQWEPALAVDIIDKSCWGNTLIDAANAFVTDTAARSQQLKDICRLLENSIPADLPEATATLINRVNNMAATNHDVVQLIDVLPPLVSITRYGNVRKTDAGLVLGILESIITRICINLPAASTHLAEDAATVMLDQYYAMNDAVQTLANETLTAQWQQALQKIMNDAQSARSLAGYATRLLNDSRHISAEALLQVFSLAMSVSNDPTAAALWLEGFLKGSGTLLLVDDSLFALLRNWMQQLEEEHFMQALPLLRRAFSAFSGPERRQIGEKVKQGGQSRSAGNNDSYTYAPRAVKGIPVIMQLLGYHLTEKKQEHA